MSKNNLGRRSTSGHDKNQMNGETDSNGVWFLEDNNSCYKTRWMDGWMAR